MVFISTDIWNISQTKRCCYYQEHNLLQKMQFNQTSSTELCLNTKIGKLLTAPCEKGQKALQKYGNEGSHFLWNKSVYKIGDFWIISQRSEKLIITDKRHNIGTFTLWVQKKLVHSIYLTSHTYIVMWIHKNSSLLRIIVILGIEWWANNQFIISEKD